jgi:hypothetical protein
MNSKLKYVGLLAILPLITTVLTTNYVIVEAEKSAGTPMLKVRANEVCGDRLCSEIPGGQAAFKKPTSAELIPQPETTPQKPSVFSEKDLGSVLKLSRANVPAKIPLHHGYYDGKAVYFIITDSSDNTHADLITKNQGWKVELAPLLANAPKEAVSTTYLFLNGISGKGVHGFQDEVFSSTPNQPDKYSGLSRVTHVTWKDGSSARLLSSENEILTAQSNGLISLEETKIVINTPQIIWPGGQMVVKEDKTLTDDTPYGGGQVLDINTKDMTVTFIAHRGWGPDGKTIYYIVTDATPTDPAEMMGVVDAPTSASLIANSAAVDLFQFANGIKGSGPMGFQPGIAASAPGDKNYSPMWRIFMIEWKDPQSASLLETRSDIDASQKGGLINVGLARPMDSDHIVNCPFIDPFQ